MTIREQMVVEMKSWIGTPYHDHAGIRGIGVDCAYFPIRVLQAVGIIPEDFKPPKYSPQQWLIKGEDTTYLDTLMKFAKREMFDESEILPGDLVLFKMHKSWTHGALVVSWPRFLLHPIKDRGVIGSQSNEGFFMGRERRFFSFVE